MIRKGELKSLTGLRGVAACCVVLYHYTGGYGFGPGRAFVQHFYTAVDLFFVLSGFVMAFVHGRSFRIGFSRQDYLAFIGRRLGRIYPLYIVLTLAMVVVIHAGFDAGAPPSSLTLASNILLIQNWGLARSINDPAWSISAEFAAYALFPFLVAAVLTGHRTRSWVAALLAVAVLAVIATRTNADLGQAPGHILYRNGPLDVHGFQTPYPLLRCLAGFTLGLVAFRLAQLPRVWRLARLRFAGDVLCVAVLALLALPGSDVALVALFVPFIVALAAERSVTATLLKTRLIHWIGLISFSIYLSHWLVRAVLETTVRKHVFELDLPYLAIAGIMFVVAIILSAATYYGIEKPGRAWMRTILERRRTLPIDAKLASP